MNIQVKSNEDAARTIKEWATIDRGFLRDIQAPIVTAAAIIVAFLGWWVVFAVLLTIT